MRKILWIFLLALGLILGLAACGTETTPPPEETLPAEATATPETEEQPEEDSDGGPGQATEISMGTLTDSLDEGAEDWYAFEVPNGHVLTVDFTAGHDAKGLNVHLFDPDQNELWQEWDVGPTVTQSTRQMMNTSSGGTYYVRVSGGRGEYTLELVSESQDDAGSGTDAGDQVAGALEVEAGQAFSGELGDFDEEDWYAFEVPDGHVLSVDFTAGDDAKGLNVHLFDPEQNELWQEWDVGPTVTQSTRQMMNTSSGGTYYVRVSGGRGEYTVELASESQDDAGSTGDAGDKVADALQVEAGQTFSGELGDFDEEDWYAFEVPDGHVLSVDFTAGDDAKGLNVHLFDPDQNELWQEWDVGPTVTQSTRQMMSSSSGGTYYVRVSGGRGEYTVELASESQDDAGSGGDAGDKAAGALQVETGQAFSGELGDFDEEDWYAFEVPDRHVLSVDFTAGDDAKGLNVHLFDPDQNELWQEWDVGSGESESVEIAEVPAGSYSIRVSGGSGSYTVELD